MSKQSFSATGLLIGGFVFFALGLLLILQQNPVSGLFTQITPNIQTIEVAGVIVQFIGQALVVLGVMKSTSHKLISSMQAERQMTMSNITQNMQQIHAEQQALKTGAVQTMAKLDTSKRSNNPAKSINALELQVLWNTNRARLLLSSMRQSELDD